MQPWFDRAGAEAWPPVLGFGLPPDDRVASHVTVALNPSHRELGRYLDEDPDPLLQWEQQRTYFQRGQLDWFDRSDCLLAEWGMSHRGGVPHLDASPVMTAGGFDGIYDKVATPAQRAEARRLVMRSMRECLFPILGALQARNGLTTVVFYGLVPPRRGGSRTMKEAVGRGGVVHAGAVDDSGPFLLGRGGLVPAHEWLEDCPGLADLRFLFLAQGPSSPGSRRRLPLAGKRLRELGWRS